MATGGSGKQHAKREKGRLIESTEKLIQEGRGRIGGGFKSQASTLCSVLLFFVGGVRAAGGLLPLPCGMPLVLPISALVL